MPSGPDKSEANTDTLLRLILLMGYSLRCLVAYNVADFDFERTKGSRAVRVLGMQSMKP